MPGIQTRKINILDRDSLESCFQEFRPDVLIHCAALANVDLCENNKREAEQINMGGTQNVVASLEGLPTQLIYISTDSVFDGEKGNYTEEDPIHPINHYGWTKYQGEQAALQREGALVLRTTIFGWNIQDKESLSEWILNRLKLGERLRGFQDVIFSGVYTFTLASLMEQAWQKKLRGIFHCASSTSLSKYEFAVQLARRFHCDESLIEPISVESLTLPARRPKNLSLSTVKLAQSLGQELPSLSDSVHAFFHDFERGLPQKIRGGSWLS